MKNNGKAIQAMSERKAIQFELLFDEISDAIILHDIRGYIIKANSSACHLFGFSKEEVNSINILNFVSTNRASNYKAILKKLIIEKKLCFETKILQKNNTEISVEIVSKIIEVDNSVIISSSIRDISIRKNYENQLIEAKKIAEENELELNAIFNNSPSSIFLFDEEMNIVRVNKKAIKKFNINEFNLHNARLGDLINCSNTKNKTTKCGSSESCNSCQLAHIFRQSITEGKSITKKEIQISIYREGKIIKKTSLISTALLKRNGHSVFLATLDDISKRKKMEQDLIEVKIKAQESDKLKTAFINNLSHEIRTPLNGILGFAGLLEDENNNYSWDQKKEFLKIMHISGERLINTVADLVEISKMDSEIVEFKPETFNLEENSSILIEELLQKYDNSKVEFISQIDHKLKYHLIKTDKSKLLQIIHHLLDNAFKFTPKGKVKFDIKAKDNDLFVSVNDSGIGISSDYYNDIFKPFWQIEKNTNRVFEGNGLGLSVAQKLVASLGGELSVKSEIGKGSEFFFHLKNVVQKLYISKNDSEKKLNLGDSTILVCEDEMSNYHYLEAVLLKENCKLIHVANGKEALAAIKENNSIDLILMDLKMPEMDGFEATAKIREIRSDIPIIAQSAFVLNEEKEKSLKVGCNDFLSKPLSKELLFKTIQKYLNSKDN